MGERVLFIRCVPQPLAMAALEALRGARPGARIEVLSNNAAGAAIAASGAADAVVTYPAAAYGIVHAGPAVILSLRRRRYDAVVVPVTPRGRAACWNVARLALLFGGAQTLWQETDPAGAPSWSPVTWRQRWTGRPALAHGRLLLLRLLTAPALVAAYVVAMTVLAIVAAVLVPLVWLKPEPGADGGRAR